MRQWYGRQTCLGFDDLDLILKITGGLRMLHAELNTAISPISKKGRIFDAVYT